MIGAIGVLPGGVKPRPFQAWVALMLLMVTVAPDSEAGASALAAYRIRIVHAQRDYRLPEPPTPGRYAVLVSDAGGADKNKLFFSRPLVPGTYELRFLADRGCADKTLVVSVPIAPGDYDFSLSSTGCARFDFAFHDDRPTKEYRLSLMGTVIDRRLHVHLPQPK